MGYILLMQTVAETPTFSRQADKLFSQDERRELIDFLAQNPLAGEEIRGTGGVRKLRFGAAGKGKRGGARVIYYYLDEGMPIYALLAYAKAARDDMTPDERRAVRALAAMLKAAWKERKMSEFGSDLIQSLSEAVAHAKGNGHAILHGPMTPRSVREQVKLTQAQMASLMGMSLSGYRKWEQGTRRVSGPTAVLLRVIEKEWSREPGVSEAVEQDRPNLFDYATKELSQDAMVCWLLKWSEHRYQSQHRALHNCGVRFVRELLQMHGASLGNEIEKMEIYRQEQHIDVLARVNNEHVLLIEDKTDTKDRGNQLEKCYQAVVRGKTRLGKVDDSLLHPIYLQTGNQPSRRRPPD